jgi:hypothetical protein
MDLGMPFVSSTLLRTEFNALLDETIQVTLISGNETIKSQAVVNPAYIKVNSVTVVSYEERKRRSPAVLVVKIEGIGFTNGLRSSVGQLVVQLPTEALLIITNPSAAQAVTLTDSVTGVQVTTVITRKSVTS